MNTYDDTIFDENAEINRKRLQRGTRRADILERAGDKAPILFDRSMCVIDICRATGISPDDLAFVRGVPRYSMSEDNDERM